MGMAAADGTGIGFDSPVIQTDTTEDVRVGLVHDVVCFVKRGFITVEGISILHDELPSAEQSEAGSQCVAEFCLYLEKGERQLRIAFEFVAEKSRNDFLQIGGASCRE